MDPQVDSPLFTYWVTQTHTLPSLKETVVISPSQASVVDEPAVYCLEQGQWSVNVSSSSLLLCLPVASHGQGHVLWKKRREGLLSSFYWQMSKNTKLLYPPAPTYPSRWQQSQMNKYPGHWNMPLSNNQYHWSYPGEPCFCCSRRRGTRCSWESWDPPLAQRPWAFSSFLSLWEHLSIAGSVLALMLGPLSPCCASLIPAMSEPIRGHFAEALKE